MKYVFFDDRSWLLEKEVPKIFSAFLVTVGFSLIPVAVIILTFLALYLFKAPAILFVIFAIGFTITASVLLNYLRLKEIHHWLRNFFDIIKKIFQKNKNTKSKH